MLTLRYSILFENRILLFLYFSYFQLVVIMDTLLISTIIIIILQYLCFKGVCRI